MRWASTRSGAAATGCPDATTDAFAAGAVFAAGSVFATVGVATTAALHWES
ncbi:hypothetical protein GCM10010406_32160 [Streptomyces thermolineatus]|uniref:Uncharacterized protein n=1 Tax=Streptomyces thermolineatus TaxID=44033 RepID=A0ABP5ZE62_9ACTN